MHCSTWANNIYGNIWTFFVRSKRFDRLLRFDIFSSKNWRWYWEAKQHFLDSFCQSITCRICKTQTKFQFRVHWIKERLSTSENLCFKRFSVHENWIWIAGSSIEKAKELNFHQVWLSVLNSNEEGNKFLQKNRVRKNRQSRFPNWKENFEFIAMTRDLQNAAAYNCEK